VQQLDTTMATKLALQYELPTKLAIQYAFSTGIDFGHLYSEALQAYWLAEISPYYDPRKSAFVTFATNCIKNQLNSVVYAYRRKNPPIFSELDESMVDTRQPSSDHITFFVELVSQLPNDAKVVARIALSDATDGVPFYKIRSTIRNMLRPVWPPSRIDKAFQALSTMLKQAESFG
jgi:hypothetical protein